MMMRMLTLDMAFKDFLKRSNKNLRNTDGAAVIQLILMVCVVMTFLYYLLLYIHVGLIYLWWSAFMFLVYSYNLISISLRASFPFVQGTNFTPIGTLNGPPEINHLGLLLMWIVLDIVMDVMYVVDVIFVSSHLVPVDENIGVKESEVCINIFLVM